MGWSCVDTYRGSSCPCCGWRSSSVIPEVPTHELWWCDSCRWWVETYETSGKHLACVWCKHVCVDADFGGRVQYPGPKQVRSPYMPPAAFKKYLAA